MKKIILLLTALLLTAGVMQSQVKIGQDTNPEKGAILDLNGTAYKGGLLLPNVDITDMGKIPTTFSDVSVAGLDDAPDLAGLLVWNTHPGSEGVYMWDGANWQLLTEDSGTTTDCSGAPSITSISGFSGTYNLNAEFDVTCNATTTGVTLYTWTVPSGLSVVSGNGTTTVRLKGSTAGTYTGNTLNCTVSNACGSATNTAGTNITVNSCSATPTKPGDMTLSATTVTVGGTITATVPLTLGVSYSWTLPSGLTGASSTNTVEILAATAGSYAAGTVTVTAVNECGTSPSSGNMVAFNVSGVAKTTTGCWHDDKAGCTCPKPLKLYSYGEATNEMRDYWAMTWGGRTWFANKLPNKLYWLYSDGIWRKIENSSISAHSMLCW
jgi:hypothetical protein